MSEDEALAVLAAGLVADPEKLAGVVRRLQDAARSGRAKREGEKS